MVNIPKDKQLHFLAGVIAGLVGLGASLLWSAQIVPWVAAAFGLLAGAGKELSDYLRNREAANDEGLEVPRDVDLWDAAYTAGGGVLVAVVAGLYTGTTG